jgi:hypothetical protein
LAKRKAAREEANEDLAQAVEAGNAEDVEKLSKRTVHVRDRPNLICVLSWFALTGEQEAQRRSEAIVAIDGCANC